MDEPICVGEFDPDVRSLGEAVTETITGATGRQMRTSWESYMVMSEVLRVESR